MELQEQYRRVLESLKLLSASEEQQEEYLPEFADIPDDVTSSFENAFLLLPQLIDNNSFSNSSLASILRLYNKMQWCLRNVGLDDFSNEEWNKVRRLARETLHLIGESLEKPDTRHV
jgi:hypothetical protein